MCAASVNDRSVAPFPSPSAPVSILLSKINQMQMLGETYHFEHVAMQDCGIVRYILVTDTTPSSLTTLELKQLLISINDASILSIIDIANIDYQSIPTIDNQLNFAWDIEILDQALSFYEEYKDFARAYPSIRLPETMIERSSYITQAALIELLRTAIKNRVKFAMQALVTVPKSSENAEENRSEDRLSSSISNLRKAAIPLLALMDIFESLGLREERTWLLEISRQHALSLLDETSSLIHDTRLYQPISLRSLHSENLLTSMYHLDDELSLEHYLLAQSRRSQFIVMQYANPLVTFLLNTEQDLKSTPQLLTWKNSIIEVDKANNGDDNNSLNDLERYFSEHLATSTQQNCKKKPDAIVPPLRRNIFAQIQRELISKVDHICKKL